MTAASAHLFEIIPTYRYLPVRSLSPMRSFRPGIQYARASGGQVAFEDRRDANGRIRRTYLDAGQNPPDGVMIEYYLKQSPSDEATLTILDGQGEVIQQFSSQAMDNRWMPAEAGMNRFVWDLRYPNARMLPRDPLLTGPGDSARASAPVAPPGTLPCSAGGGRAGARAAVRDPERPADHGDRRRPPGAVRAHGADSGPAVGG